MSRLPQFQSSAQIEREPITPATGFGNTLTDLANKVQQLSGQNYLRQRVSAAQSAGAVAGSQLNFQPTQGGGIAQQAFNQAALATNKQMLSTDVMLKIPQLHQQAIADHPTNIEAAQNEFQQLANQYQNNILQNAPTQNQAYAKNMLNYHIGMANLQLNQRLIQQRRMQAQGQFVISDNASNNAVNNAISSINFNQEPDEVQNQVNAAQQMLAHRFNGIDLAEEGGLITGDKAAALKDMAMKQFKMNLITRHYEAAWQDGNGSQYLKQIMNNPLQGFSELDKAELVHKLQRVTRGLQTANESDKLSQQLSGKNYIQALTTGGQRNVQIESEYKQTFPDRAQFFDEQVQNAQYVGQTSLDLKEMSFNDQQQQLDQLKPNPNDPNYSNDLARYTAIQKQVAQFNHNYNMDKVATLQNNPSIVSAAIKKYNQLNAGYDFTQLNSAGFKPTTANPEEKLVIAQVLKGTPLSDVSVVTRNNAKNMVNQIEGLSSNPQQQIQLINQWRNQYGKTFPILMRDLKQYGNMGFFPMYLASTSPNDPAIPQLETALTVPESELMKSLSKTQQTAYNTQMQNENGDLENLIKTYTNANSFDSQDYVRNLRATERKLTLAYMVNKNMGPSEARQAAVNYLTQSFNVTSIGGSSVRLPNTVNINNVKLSAQAFQQKLLPTFDYNVPKGWLKQAYYQSVIQGGHWVTNNTNTGLIWVDVNGNPVKNSKGQTFGFNFNEANQAYSSKEVINQYIKQAKDIKDFQNQMNIWAPSYLQMEGL